MPLKIRKEWVDVPGGERVERELYEVETAIGKLRDQLSRKTAPDPAGYTWTLGYNNLVGRYSQGRRYSKFGGSSLCRSKQLKLDYGETPKSVQADNPDLSPATNNILRMARKVQGRMSTF